MSRKYQGLIILNAKNIDGTVEDTITSISKELETEGAKIENVNAMGRREFAYPSNHLDAGHYVDFTFSAEPALIGKIKSRLSLNESVHVQQYQRIA